jgi:hypothetical protein
MFRFVRNIVTRIRMWFILRKKLKQLRKRDPFIYK